jgi:hypothetical protein
VIKHERGAKSPEHCAYIGCAGRSPAGPIVVSSRAITAPIMRRTRRCPGFPFSCTRLPARLEKVEKLRTRLHADAQTRGSLAFLQARIGTAKAAGHTDQARLLSDRLAVRKDLDASLPDILTHLLDAKQVCDARSAGTTS